MELVGTQKATSSPSFKPVSLALAMKAVSKAIEAMGSKEYMTEGDFSVLISD